MDPVLHLTLRACFALLLATAASHKWRDLTRFREVLAAYEILPRDVALAAAPVVAAVESLLAVMVALGSPVAALATSLLLLTYAAAIHANVRRGRTAIDCGCMGPAARVPLGSGLVVRNLVLASGAALMATAPSTRLLGSIDVAAALAATAALSACWLAAERLLALAPRAAELSRKTRPEPQKKRRSELARKVE